jgi:pimeloyl-ACP methyl ester carboxylesterase
MAEYQKLDVGDSRLACVDFGGDGPGILALHGHFGRACLWNFLGEALAGQFRVVALEQRGQGINPPAGEYSRESYIRDAAGAIETLGLSPAVVVGHSLGAINAYQLAARRGDLVRAIVVEDFGTEFSADVSWILKWPTTFSSRREAMEFLARTMPGEEEYFAASLVEAPRGWAFTWRGEDMFRSMQAICGDWWKDWLGSKCPALLLRGGKSPVLSKELADEMQRRRPDTRLLEFPAAGHHVHDSDRPKFIQLLKDFLAELPKP